MGLTKCKLGKHIELRTSVNSSLQYGVDEVRGVNNLKKLMQTKADLNGRDLSKFQIVYSGEFVFNHRTSRNGSKFSIAYNDGSCPVICTEDYVVFRIKAESRDILLAEWLYMFFNRSEFDRYVITNSWGSSTEFYNWEDLCDIDINLPPLSVQHKYVNIYKAMVANQQSYERGLDDLKQALYGLFDKIKYSCKKLPMSELVSEIDERNESGNCCDVQGINITKQFMTTAADTNGIDLTKYKVVRKGQLAFSGMQTGRDKCIRIAMHTKEEPIIVSPAYTVFEVNRNIVLSEYVMCWFSRPESDRLGWFMSDSSIRSNLDLDRLYETAIPIPALNSQRAIADIYKVYTERRRINEQLKDQIKNICPILIRGSLLEGGR